MAKFFTHTDDLPQIEACLIWHPGVVDSYMPSGRATSCAKRPLCASSIPAEKHKYIFLQQINCARAATHAASSLSPTTTERARRRATRGVGPRSTAGAATHSRSLKGRWRLGSVRCGQRLFEAAAGVLAPLASRCSRALVGARSGRPLIARARGGVRRVRARPMF